jgi:hypothetical protein
LNTGASTQVQDHKQAKAQAAARFCAAYAQPIQTARVCSYHNQHIGHHAATQLQLAAILPAVAGTAHPITSVHMLQLSHVDSNALS